MWCLIGHAPYNDSTAIMVAFHIVTQLAQGVFIGGGIVPVDSPIDGNLAPEQQSFALCQPYHLLVMRIMGQSEEVAAQLLGPTDECLVILFPCAAARLERCFFVDGYSAQENLFAIEQDFVAGSLYVAKTDFVA